MLKTKRNLPFYLQTYTFLVLLGAIEIFIVQWLTLQPELAFKPYRLLIALSLRMALNLMAYTILLFLLRRFWLYIIFFVQFIFFNSVITFHGYFDRALSWPIISTQAGEGIKATSAAVAYMDIPWMLFFVCFFIIKVLLASRRQRHYFQMKSRYFFCLVLIYVITITAMVNYIDRLEKLKYFASTGRMGVTYGYLWTWIGEAYYLGQAEYLPRALAAADERSDLITPRVPLVGLGDKVVIIQFESLDYDMLDCKINQQYVAPFLNRLSRNSMLWRLRAFHFSGSASADFCLLTGNTPLREFNPYKIEEYPYDNSTPQIAQSKGFEVSAFHGNKGNFYNRRPVFEKMGFDQIFFLEEMKNQLMLKEGFWGIDDRDVFNLSSTLLKKSSGKTMHFIITLTSHTPFTDIRDEDKIIFRQPSNLCENYMNSIHYVDSVLGKYIEGLPEGTTVVIYGDHASKAYYKEKPQWWTQEWIPFIIYKKGIDLSSLQKSRDVVEFNRIPVPATNEKTWDNLGPYYQQLSKMPSMLDGVTYLRNCLKMDDIPFNRDESLRQTN